MFIADDDDLPDLGRNGAVLPSSSPRLCATLLDSAVARSVTISFYFYSTSILATVATLLDVVGVGTQHTPPAISQMSEHDHYWPGLL